MEPNDTSANSGEDEQFNKGGSSMEAGTFDTNDSTQQNIQSLQKCDETGHGDELKIGSRDKDENLKVGEFVWSVTTFGEDSTSNIPPAIDIADLQTPESMLSSTSSDESCGSSDPSDITSYKYEPLGEIQDTGEKRESDRIWDLENPISWLRCRNIKISNSPSTTSPSGTSLENASQATKWAFTSAKGSSFQEDSTSIKSQDTSNTHDPVDSSSFPQETFSGHIKEREEPSAMPQFSLIKEWFSNMDTKALFGTSEISDSGKTPGAVAYSDEENYWKNEKSVRRKVRKELPAREVETSEISDRVKTPADFVYISDEENYWKNEKSVRRKVQKELPTREVETLEISASGKTPEALDYIIDDENYWKNDKSVRRKVRKELPTGEVETLEISASGKTPEAVDYIRDEENYWKNEKSVRRKVRKELPTREFKTSEISDIGKTPGAVDYNSDLENYWKNEKSMIRKIRKELPTREFETSETSDIGKTPGAVDDNSDLENYWKNEKSVRRKVKKELPTSPKTDSLPTSSSVPSIPLFSRNIGRSLLQISKSVEQTLPANDWDLSKNCARRNRVKYFVPKPWVEDFLSLGYETTAELESKKLLHDVHDFFENYHMDSYVNMSWEERKHQIITSKYFSDEFCRSQELATYEELLKRGLKDLETSTPPIAKTELELRKLCKTLIERRISEDDFVESVGRELLNMLCVQGYGKDFTPIEPHNRQSQDYLNSIFDTIIDEYDLLPMVKLYAKMVYDGATYLSIINESK